MIKCTGFVKIHDIEVHCMFGIMMLYQSNLLIINIVIYICCTWVSGVIYRILNRSRGIFLLLFTFIYSSDLFRTIVFGHTSRADCVGFRVSVIKFSWFNIGFRTSFLLFKLHFSIPPPFLTRHTVLKTFPTFNTFRSQ